MMRNRQNRIQRGYIVFAAVALALGIQLIRPAKANPATDPSDPGLPAPIRTNRDARSGR